MSNTYELMFILRPNLNHEQVNQERKKYHDLLKEKGAEKVGMKFWGKRRLAYPIQNFQDGVYILANFTGDGKQVAPVERAMRLSDEVMRYLTLKLKTDIEFDQAQFNPNLDLSTQPEKSPVVENEQEESSPETPETPETVENTEVEAVENTEVETETETETVAVAEG